MPRRITPGGCAVARVTCEGAREPKDGPGVCGRCAAATFGTLNKGIDMTKTTGERVSAALVSRLRKELEAWKARAESDAGALRREREGHASSRAWLGRQAVRLDERKDEVIRLSGELADLRAELAEEKRLRKHALASVAQADADLQDVRRALDKVERELAEEKSARRESWDDAAKYVEALIVRCGQEPQLHALARVSAYRSTSGRIAVEMRFESSASETEGGKIPPAESMRIELDAGPALMMGTELHAELSAVMRRAMRIGGGR